MSFRDQVQAFIPRQGSHYDVIVAGGGPAGIGAALGSAMQGARTLMLEARSFFGGVAAIAMWMPMNRLLLDDGQRGGVHDRFVDKIRAYGDFASVPGSVNFINGDGMDIHPDYLRLACFELFEDLKCDYRLYSPAVGAVLDGKTVRGVLVQTKTGIQEFTADVVVDASGDGDVAAAAGADFMQGREDDGRSMPISLVFALSNVDVETFFAWKADHGDVYEALLRKAKAQGYAVAAWYAFDRTTVPGTLNVNNGALHDVGHLDGLLARDLTIAERAGIQVATDFVKFAREYKLPGLEKCHLMRVGANAGVRDTRRIVGDYVLTLEDAQNGTDFPDVIARKYGAIDANQLYIGPMHSGFGYPYRSLLPKGLDNLLVAGRCGSASFLGHAAGKSMGNMMEVGQAAGVAAAMSSARGCTPRDLPVADLQATLRGMGVHL